MGGKSDSIPVQVAMFAPLLATGAECTAHRGIFVSSSNPVAMETVAHGTQEAGKKWQKRHRVVPKYRFPIDRWLGQEVVCVQMGRH